MTTRSIGLLLLLASPALAHLVTIEPSTCALDIQMLAPVAGVTFAVDPPPAGELLRASYTPDANADRSHMQVCPADAVDPVHRCATVAPSRGFVAAGVSGSIALPSAFAFRLLANGDLSATAVPVTITYGASGAVTVPFELATGLVPVGPEVFSGTPLDATGAFGIVGTGTSAALPAPLGGTPIELGLACTMVPPPDLDQFALAPRLTKVRGVLTTKQAKLTMVLESEVTMPAAFAAVPTIIQLAAEGAPVLVRTVTLVGSARGRFESSDGDVTAKPLRSRTTRVMKIVLREALTASGYSTANAEVAVSSGGLMATRAVSAKANRRGTRLVVHER